MTTTETTIRARLGSRYYRLSERLTPDKPKWLHRLICSHCRGLDAYAGAQARTRR